MGARSSSGLTGLRAPGLGGRACGPQVAVGQVCSRAAIFPAVQAGSRWAWLAVRTGIAASTAHRVLHRHSLPALAAVDRATGEPVRRYERARPGELAHDVKKLRRIPDGGGHRVLGRAAGSPNKDRRNGAGYAFLHTVLDDRSRLACTEDLPDETAVTCAGFLCRVITWFSAHGVTVERVLTDNVWAHTKNTWRDTCRNLGISPRWTRPWRPQTNGKAERFHRTLLDE